VLSQSASHATTPEASRAQTPAENERDSRRNSQNTSPQRSPRQEGRDATRNSAQGAQGAAGSMSGQAVGGPTVTTSIAAGTRGGQQQQAVATATTTSASSSAWKNLGVVIPLVFTTLQAMGLYFQAWQWPVEIYLPFSFFVYVFSIDLSLALPRVPIEVTYGIQYALAILAVLYLFHTRRRDSYEYQTFVIDGLRCNSAFIYENQPALRSVAGMMQTGATRVASASVLPAPVLVPRGETVRAAPLHFTMRSPVDPDKAVRWCAWPWEWRKRKPGFIPMCLPSFYVVGAGSRHHVQDVVEDLRAQLFTPGPVMPHGGRSGGSPGVCYGTNAVGSPVEPGPSSTAMLLPDSVHSDETVALWIRTDERSVEGDIVGEPWWELTSDLTKSDEAIGLQGLTQARFAFYEVLRPMLEQQHVGTRTDVDDLTPSAMMRRRPSKVRVRRPRVAPVQRPLDLSTPAGRRTHLEQCIAAAVNTIGVVDFQPWELRIFEAVEGRIDAQLLSLKTFENFVRFLTRYHAFLIGFPEALRGIVNDAADYRYQMRREKVLRNALMRWIGQKRQSERGLDYRAAQKNTGVFGAFAADEGDDEKLVADDEMNALPQASLTASQQLPAVAEAADEPDTREERTDDFSDPRLSATRNSSLFGLNSTRTTAAGSPNRLVAEDSAGAALTPSATTAASKRSRVGFHEPPPPTAADRRGHALVTKKSPSAVHAGKHRTTQREAKKSYFIDLRSEMEQLAMHRVEEERRCAVDRWSQASALTLRGERFADILFPSLAEAGLRVFDTHGDVSWPDARVQASKVLDAYFAVLTISATERDSAGNWIALEELLSESDAGRVRNERVNVADFTRTALIRETRRATHWRLRLQQRFSNAMIIRGTISGVRANGTGSVMRGGKVINVDDPDHVTKQCRFFFHPVPRVMEDLSAASKNFGSASFDGTTPFVIDITDDIYRCPYHGRRLIWATDELQLAVRLMHPEGRAYPCAGRGNRELLLAVGSRNSGPDRLYKQKANKSLVRNSMVPPLARDHIGERVLAEPCDDDDLLVCQQRRCNFCLCDKCSNIPGKRRRILAQYSTQRHVVTRLGAFSVLGFLLVILAQAMYLPAVKSAVMVTLCHVQLVCSYPGCYEKITPAFVAMVGFSAVLLLILGLGLVLLMCIVVFRRKERLVRSGVLSGQFSIGGQEMRQDPATTWQVIRCDLPAHVWQGVLSLDKSMFKVLYEQYEFKYAVFQPVTLVFKVLLVAVVLFVGEPNTLQQLVGAAAVELLQLGFYTFTNPFVDPWIDTLAKAGSLHQVLQLALMCQYRVNTARNPTDRAIGQAMFAVAVIYLCFVVVILCVLVAVPFIRHGWYNRRAKRLRRSAKRHEVKNLEVERDRADEAAYGRARCVSLEHQRRARNMPPVVAIQQNLDGAKEHQLPPRYAVPFQVPALQADLLSQPAVVSSPAPVPRVPPIRAPSTVGSAAYSQHSHANLGGPLMAAGPFPANTSVSHSVGGRTTAMDESGADGFDPLGATTRSAVIPRHRASSPNALRPLDLIEMVEVGSAQQSTSMAENDVRDDEYSEQHTPVNRHLAAPPAQPPNLAASVRGGVMGGMWRAGASMFDSSSPQRPDGASVIPRTYAPASDREDGMR
jgi:hypothetical protein